MELSSAAIVFVDWLGESAEAVDLIEVSGLAARDEHGKTEIVLVDISRIPKILGSCEMAAACRGRCRHTYREAWNRLQCQGGVGHERVPRADGDGYILESK